MAKAKPTKMFPIAIFVTEPGQAGADFWAWCKNWEELRNELKYLVDLRHKKPQEIAVYTSCNPADIPPNVAAICRLVHTPIQR